MKCYYRKSLCLLSAHGAQWQMTDSSAAMTMLGGIVKTAAVMLAAAIEFVTRARHFPHLWDHYFPPALYTPRGYPSILQNLFDFLYTSKFFTKKT